MTGEAPNPFLDQEAFTLWDASIRWETGDGRWGFSLTGKNLTDEEYIVAGYNFVNIVNGAFVPNLGLEGTLTIEDWGPNLALPGAAITADNVDDSTFWGNLVTPDSPPDPLPAE